MSDTDKPKMRWFLKAELVILACAICLWIIKLVTVDIDSGKATVTNQFVRIKPNSADSSKGTLRIEVTIAKIIASQGADQFYITEYDSADAMSVSEFDRLEQDMYYLAPGKGGRAYIINEAHGLRKRRWANVTERFIYALSPALKAWPAFFVVCGVIYCTSFVNAPSEAPCHLPISAQEIYTLPHEVGCDCRGKAFLLVL